MNWFYAEDDRQVGPISQADFDSLVLTGKISADTQVWHDKLPEWSRYGDLAPASVAAEPLAATPRGAMVSSASPTGVTHRCVECGNSFPESEMIAFENAWVCAACKPVFVQKLKEGLAPANVLNYAGFWVRVGAKFVDGIILQVVNLALGFCVGLAMGSMGGAKSAPIAAGVIGFLFGISYITFFNGRFGATPGKMALKLKIVRPNGEAISYARALGRYFGEMLSTMTLFIGFMMAGWDEQKRALHDRVCDTRVIRQ